jgi:hypothetical protein
VCACIESSSGQDLYVLNPENLGGATSGPIAAVVIMVNGGYGVIRDRPGAARHRYGCLGTYWYLSTINNKPPTMTDPTANGSDPSFPLEVLALVISSSSSSTLSKWMRVNSQCNKVAAPCLYQYITLRDEQPSIFTAATNTVIPESISRKSADKMSNLDKIKGITISELASYRSKGDWTVPAKEISVDWMRINNMGHAARYNDPSFLSFDPRKIIVHGSGGLSLSVENWRPKTAVLILSPENPNYEAIDHNYMETMDTIVYIFWSHTPSQPAYRHERQQLEDMCEGLTFDWKDDGGPTRAIFVNAGGIYHRQFCDMGGCVWSAPRPYAETELEFKRIFDEAFEIASEMKDIDGDLPVCTFMTLQEYLTTHDWSGEFTAEEARPWLDASGTEEWQ